MIKANGLASHLHYGSDPSEPTPYVVVPLFERFEGEDGERWYLMMSVSTMASGFQVRLVNILQIENHTSGSAFCSEDGKSVLPGEIDEVFQSQQEKFNFFILT